MKKAPLASTDSHRTSTQGCSAASECVFYLNVHSTKTPGAGVLSIVRNNQQCVPGGRRPFTAQAGTFFDAGLAWVSRTFGWYYMLAVVAYLVFVVLIGGSRFGSIRLGPDHSRPEFSLLSWSAMLFAAGIGIDLLFFSVAEPVAHYLAPPDL